MEQKIRLKVEDVVVSLPMWREEFQSLIDAGVCLPTNTEWSMYLDGRVKELVDEFDIQGEARTNFYKAFASFAMANAKIFQLEGSR